MILSPIYVLRFRLCSHEVTNTSQVSIYQADAFPQLFLYKKAPIYTKGGSSRKYKTSEKKWYIYKGKFIDSDAKLFKMIEKNEIT